MNRSGDKRTATDGDAVEALLEQATPRLAPPAGDEQTVRDAVRAEWRSETGRRFRRRRAAGIAVAASMVLAITVALNAFRETGIAPVELASITTSHGSIFLRGNDDQPVVAGDVATVFAGQSMTTGDDAGAGLEWAKGGSLRIDEGTRVEFLATDAIYLHSGRVYFDSAETTVDQSLSIETPFGTVTPLGTQFMTNADDDGLTVSVREGQVDIDGRFHEQTAHEGQRVALIGNGRPTVTNISGTGTEWVWVEAVSPGLDIDGRPVYEFLRWVGRETGYSLEFASADAERLAKESLLRGSVERDPRSELRMRMMTTDLRAEFDTGRSVLVISESR